MKVFSVHISNFKIDGGAMFGVVPKMLWQKVYPADENNLCNWALRSILVDTGERRILVDNGYGNKQDEKYFSYVYLNGGDGLDGGLAKAGYRPEDITDMVLTHLHADHCGGGIRYNANRSGFETVFPNATYWISRSHWEWAINPNLREKDAFLEENLIPIMDSGQIQFVEEDTHLAPGFEVRIFNGHTCGQIIPFIHYEDKTIVFTADLIPSYAHIPLVYNMSYDVEPLVTIAEKETFLKEALEHQYILFFEHDIFHECCLLTDTPKGIRAGTFLTLEEITGLQQKY
ncbi:MAG: MBL fold metallo-hydrolase [Chlorobi bacterium]|nr:MBL fold metallo-hydrolase [Chlorobiota bacterium]